MDEEKRKLLKEELKRKMDARRVLVTTTGGFLESAEAYDGGLNKLTDILSELIDEALEAILPPKLETVYSTLSDEEVWLRVYTSVTNTFNGGGKTACDFADSALERFRLRFRQPPGK